MAIPDRLKMRAWMKKEKKMVDVSCFDYANNMIWYVNDQGKIEYIHVCDCILLQCTGLKDKNGVLIYEGDIIKYGHVLNLFLVEWCDKQCQWSIGSIGGFEVVGNIHQNPELLKQEGAC